MSSPSLEQAKAGTLTVCVAPVLQLKGVSHAFATCRSAEAAGDLDFGDRTGFVDGTERLVRQLGFTVDRFFRVKQVHGAEIEVVDRQSEARRLRFVEADALVSATPGTLLGIRTADCVPVLLLHERTRVVAAVHAGWRGIVAGVLQRTVAVIEQQFGAEARGLTAAVGPCVGPCCYEVAQEVADRFAGLAGVVHQRKGARPHLDLGQAVIGILARCGLAANQVAHGAPCTCCRPDLFHSYRRDGAAAGRQLSAIGLLPEQGSDRGGPTGG